MKHSKNQAPVSYYDNNKKEAEIHKSAKSKKCGLYLRFNCASDKNINKAKIITSIFEGDLPLYFYYLDEKRYEKMKSEDFVSVNKTMLDELKRLLGNENVALID